MNGAIACAGSDRLRRVGPLERRVSQAFPPPDDNGAPSIDLLHRLYRDRLRRYFLKHLGATDADVEDFIQETFLRLSKPGRLDDIANVEAYVFQIAANLIAERARQRASRGETVHGGVDAEFKDETLVPAERALEARQDLAAIVRALQELPARTRAIFLLQRFEGMTYVEIAKKLGVTPSAIDKQMARAIAHLAKALKERT
jgi:RNA polymerase sigma-70 factor (ECF subfamily)